MVLRNFIRPEIKFTLYMMRCAKIKGIKVCIEGLNLSQVWLARYYTYISDVIDIETDLNVITPWKSLPSFLKEFKSWLVSPDAKNKPVRQAEQHVVQVTKIWAAASSEMYGLEPLFDRKLIRDKWLVELDNQKEPANC